MEDYKPNSRKYKEEQLEAAEDKKRVEKVVQGTVRTKKKTGISKLTDAFISEDAKSVKNYIFTDVLIPAAKKTISDIVTNGIDMILYGGSGQTKRRSNADRVSYSRYYDRRDDDRRSIDASRARTRYNYDDVVLETRGEAEDVLDRLNELIDTYGYAAVNDLYDLVGITGNYTDSKYGWTEPIVSEPIRVRDGYMLKLPRVSPLK